MSSNANGTNDPRRPEKVNRYKLSSTFCLPDDQIQEYMNVVGMIFSMVGLMMKVSRLCILKSNGLKIKKKFSSGFLLFQPECLPMLVGN